MPSKEPVSTGTAVPAARTSPAPWESQGSSDFNQVNIKTHIRIVDLLDIDTKEVTFKVHLVVFHEWDAPSRETESVLEEGCDRMDINWRPKWRPSFELVGATNSAFVHEFYSIKVGNWYRVNWRCEIKTDIVQSMDLKEFPIDLQDLTIKYRLRHSIREAAIVPFTVGNFKSEDALSLVDLSYAELELPAYRLFNKAPFCGTMEDEIYFGRDCSTVTVQLNYAREPMYYVMNIVSIEMALLFVNLGAWALKIGPTGGRYIFDLIVILTELNFRGMINDKLPEISYLTIIDKYLLACFFLKMAAFAFHCAQISVPMFAGREADSAAGVAFAVGLVAIHLVFFLYAIRLRRLRETQIKAQCEAARSTANNRHNRRMSMALYDSDALVTGPDEGDKIPPPVAEVQGVQVGIVGISAEALSVLNIDAEEIEGATSNEATLMTLPT